MLHWLGLHFKNLINFVCIEHASVTFTIANTVCCKILGL